METAALKSELIALIADIEDKTLLHAVKTMLDYRKKEKFIDLTWEQEHDLLEASEQGKNGHYIEQTVLDIKVERWLKEK
jgi:hypothetical protein